MKWFSVVFLLFLVTSSYGGSYTSSAHGSSAYGVKRTSTELSSYSRGNCAHCHEMHGSINGVEPSPSGGVSPFTLFTSNFNTDKEQNPYSQSDNFCFYCHTSSGSYQSGGLVNYSYSRTFGGYTSSSVSSILDAFNQSSYHNLYDVWSYAKSNFSWFKEDSNPCNACHNPHRAKRIKGAPTNPGANTAVSLPTDHESLWGDDSGEKIQDYTANYQPPYYYGSTTCYEPGCVSAAEARQNLPDYNTFCLSCHQNSVPTGGVNQLRAINWGVGGDKHGLRNADGGLDVRPPYDGASLGYVLSCTDCHEPHGSPNIFLVREEINGESLEKNIQDFSEPKNNMGYICRKCHKDDSLAKGGRENHWRYVHHCSSDAPYWGSCRTCHKSWPWPRTLCSDYTTNATLKYTCYDCHYHGSTKDPVGWFNGSLF